MQVPGQKEGCPECVCAASFPSSSADWGSAGSQDPGQRHSGRAASGKKSKGVQLPKTTVIIVLNVQFKVASQKWSHQLNIYVYIYIVFQSRSSLEMMESQSCDAEPPPPPKPELRFPGISRGNTEGTVCFVLNIYFLSSSDSVTAVVIYVNIIRFEGVCFLGSCSCNYCSMILDFEPQTW